MACRLIRVDSTRNKRSSNAAAQYELDRALKCRRTKPQGSGGGHTVKTPVVRKIIVGSPPHQSQLRRPRLHPNAASGRYPPHGRATSDALLVIRCSFPVLLRTSVAVLLGSNSAVIRHGKLSVVVEHQQGWDALSFPSEIVFSNYLSANASTIPTICIAVMVTLSSFPQSLASFQ